MSFVVGVAINLFIPLLGVIAYFLLCRRMRRIGIRSPPYLSYFILFATFGGWLLVALTGLFSEWSGMASLGFAALVFVAPFVTTGVAFSLRNRRALSGFHRGAYLASAAYSVITMTLIVGVLVIGWIVETKFGIEACKDQPNTKWNPATSQCLPARP